MFPNEPTANNALQRTAPSAVSELGVVRRRSRHPMNEDKKKAIEKLLARPRTSKDDNEFLQHYWDTAFAMLDALDGEYVLRALQLPQPWRAVYTTFRLDAEVRNGGFHQFFWNSEGVLNAATEEDLGFIGAVDIQKIFKRAVTCFTEFDVAGDKQRSEKTWEKFTAGYKTIPWDDFDKGFYEASPTLFQRVACYIREHKNDFTRNA